MQGGCQIRNAISYHGHTLPSIAHWPTRPCRKDTLTPGIRSMKLSFHKASQINLFPAEQISQNFGDILICLFTGCPFLRSFCDGWLQTKLRSTNLHKRFLFARALNGFRCMAPSSGRTYVSSCQDSISEQNLQSVQFFPVFKAGKPISKGLALTVNRQKLTCHTRGEMVTNLRFVLGCGFSSTLETYWVGS